MRTEQLFIMLLTFVVSQSIYAAADSSAVTEREKMIQMIQESRAIVLKEPDQWIIKGKKIDKERFEDLLDNPHWHKAYKREKGGTMWLTFVYKSS